MKATDRIPIVMATAGDALRTGLVTNLARPGGNVTGLSLALVDLAGKSVELLREALPRATRLATLVHSQDPLHREFLAEAESSAGRLGLRFRSAIVDGAKELDTIFQSLARDRVEGVVVQPIFTLDPETRAAVVRLALKHRMATVSGLRRFAEAGDSRPMLRNSATWPGVPPSTWTRSSRAPGRAICPWSSPRASSLSSTARPRRPSASRSRAPCCSAPTMSSTEGTPR